MRLRWDVSVAKEKVVTDARLINNPISTLIQNKKAAGMPQQQIVEDLIKQGYKLNDIRKTFIALNKYGKDKSMLDWRSPTAINETSRLLRNDVRKGKISYAFAMQILLKARNALKTMIMNPRLDHRLPQIENEIRVTKKLLMPRYANPLMVQQYKTF